MVPHSDFSFKLLAKVVANRGSTGYLAEVTPERMGDDTIHQPRCDDKVMLINAMTFCIISGFATSQQSPL